MKPDRERLALWFFWFMILGILAAGAFAFYWLVNH